MTESQVENQQQVEQKSSDKEFNFRKVEARSRELENQLNQERQARFEMERQLQDLQKRPSVSDDDDDDDNEPYVDKKKLNKKLNSFEKKMEEKFDKRVEEKARNLIQQKEEEEWISKHDDFEAVLNEENLTRFLNKAPAMAASIKRMPDGPEKQKLVYNAIKTMGLDKADQKQPSIQDKIDSNRRSAYYIPGGPATPPYAMAGDFSEAGRKAAYDKMKKLQQR